MIEEFVVPADSDLTPCPMGCGRLTEDPAGGPCRACWAAPTYHGRTDQVLHFGAGPSCCGEPMVACDDHGRFRCFSCGRTGSVVFGGRKILK